MSASVKLVSSDLPDRPARLLPLGLRHRAAPGLARPGGAISFAAIRTRDIRRPRAAGRSSAARHVLRLRRPLVSAAARRHRDRLRGAAHRRRARRARPEGDGARLPLDGGGIGFVGRADHALAASRRARRRAGPGGVRPGGGRAVRARRRLLLGRRHDPGPPPDPTERTGAIVLYFSLLCRRRSGSPRSSLGWKLPSPRDFARSGADRRSRRHRPDPADPELPLRRRLARRAVRVHDHDLGDLHRLLRLRHLPDRAGDRRRGDRGGAGLFVLWRERQLGLDGARRSRPRRGARRAAERTCRAGLGRIT